MVLKSHWHIYLIRKFYNAIWPWNKLPLLTDCKCLLFFSTEVEAFVESNHGDSQLSYVNNHYRRTSSLPILMFTSAPGCFYYSGHSTWESSLLFVKLLTSKHRLEKSPLPGVQNCHVPLK